MNNINYDPNERFYDFSLNENDLNVDQLNRLNYLKINEEQFYYFVSMLDKKSKAILKTIFKQQIKNIIYKKRLDNLNAVQNNIVYKKGKNDNQILFQDYQNYYHLIFEYNVDKLQQIKDILHNKYNIENVNLYQYDQKNLIYIFDKDSNFESKINNHLFSNLNNRINNYKKDKLLEQKIFVCDLPQLYLFSTPVWHCDYYKGLYLITFNNIFDQNWYNKFCHNIKLFFDKEL